MFGWFQRLLPKSGDFFSMYERHAAAMVAAAAALGALTRGEGDRIARFFGAACIGVGVMALALG